MEKQLNILDCKRNIIASVAELYHKTKESLDDDVETLRTWMESQPHLPEILDDKSLQNFLILNKCNMEKTKRRIDMYYTIRNQMPDIYQHINPKNSNIQEVSKLVYYAPLPKMTKDMYRLFIIKFRCKEMVNKVQPLELLRVANNIQEIRLKEDVMVGDIAIFDYDGVTMRFLTKLTPSLLLKGLKMYQEVYSIPLKGVYIINAHPLFSTVLAILKRILKPKIFSRIHVCKDASILTEVFPLEILPRNYGGTEKSLEELFELFTLKFEQYKDRFNVLDQLRVNEDLRPSTV